MPQVSCDDDSMAKEFGEDCEFGVQLISCEKAANSNSKGARGPIIINYDKLLKNANKQIEQTTEDSIVSEGNEGQKV